MPLKAESLPLATPLDPAEEPPGSIDPLGTLSAAERLADVLLPGFTARMWRARLLTFTTVSAAIADRVVALMGRREEVRLEARLAFERLYVSAIVRMHQKDPGNYAGARRRLPGTDLARKALSTGEPLTRSNFLKGQAVNGPFGVMARLARNLELVDDEGYLGRNAPSLLLAWSEDQELPGILDDEGPTDRPGAAWAAEVTKLVAAYVGKNQWPGANHRIWEQLAAYLRPDQAVAASTSPHMLVDTVLGRHEQVHREKRKNTWIDRESQWTLMPGFGVEGDVPAVYAGTYLHPIRILNTYSMLVDLGQVSVETADGEE